MNTEFVIAGSGELRAIVWTPAQGWRSRSCDSPRLQRWIRELLVVAIQGRYRRSC